MVRFDFSVEKTDFRIFPCPTTGDRHSVPQKRRTKIQSDWFVSGPTNHADRSFTILPWVGFHRATNVQGELCIGRPRATDAQPDPVSCASSGPTAVAASTCINSTSTLSLTLEYLPTSRSRASSLTLNITATSNRDLYAPPAAFYTTINGQTFSFALTPQPWGASPCDVAVTIAKHLGTMPLEPGNNTLVFGSLNNVLCVASLAVTVPTVSYYPNIQSLSPSAGPIEGNTTVTVAGSSVFPDDLPLCCRFGDTEVPFVHAANATSGVCVSPPNATRDVPFALVPGAHSPFVEVNTPEEVFSYYNFTVTGAFVASAGASAAQQHLVSVVGEGFEDFGATECALANATHRYVVTGAVSNATSVVCLVDAVLPAVEHRAFNLSVSLNREDFFDTGIALVFEFAGGSSDAPAPSGWVVIVAFLVSIGCIILAVVVCLAVLLRRAVRRKKHPDDLIRPSEVQCIEIIGRGSFGDVWSATWRGQTIAVKIVATSGISKSSIVQIRQEAKLMKKLRHPSVLQYFGTATDKDCILIAMEYMQEGSVRGLLNRTSCDLTWKLRLSMLIDAACGMLYLHSLNPPIIHRDLKSHNLLVNSKWEVKVCDFGLSIGVKQNEYMQSNILGTLAWIAPEIFAHAPYNTRVDVYSFGIVMWEVLTRLVPYKGLDRQTIQHKVVVEKARPLVPGETHPAYRSLMEACWDENPNLRPDFGTVVTRLRAIRDGNEMVDAEW